MTRLFLITLLLLSTSLYAHQRDSFEVYFPLNGNQITRAEQQKIDSLIYRELLYPSATIAIIGYADYLASDDYDLKLSQQRAENVRAYLINAGFKAENIVVCTGKGKIAGTPNNGNLGSSADRKVVIAFAKKEKKATLSKEIKDLKVNETLALKNINFWAGSAMILDNSKPELEKLYNILKVNPKIKIRIEGHICCDPFNTNFYLSVDRAKVVYMYLINKGIDSSRLDYKGMGIADPISKTENTEAERTLNRRVEIRILQK